MKARIPRAYDSLAPSEQKGIYHAIYREAAKKAAAAVVEISEELARERTGLTIECCLLAGLIACHDEFGCGTDDTRMGGRKLKLNRFADTFMDMLSEAAGRYDEYMLGGLREQAHRRGINVEVEQAKAVSKTLDEIANDIERRIKGE